MSPLKRVVHPAIIAMGPAIVAIGLCVATALTMAVSSNLATAGDAPTGVLGSTEATDPLQRAFRPSADGGSYTEPYLTLTLGSKRQIGRFAKTLCGGGVAGTLLPMASGFTPQHDVTLPPMSAMSYKSKLVANATGGKHNDVQVDSLSARKLIAWVDLLCPYWNEDDIRATPDPDPTDPYFANSAYPPRTPGVEPFADSPYPPRMKNAPVVDRAYRQDSFPTQQDRLREVTAVPQ